ncbi:type I-E CRISPR-associated protein Cas6/Cse3/CasE [Actinobaculum sp. 313]|nr:type I-E CRISPR-associated protein Cas6/Cse3/CasE [Actinobaculum sp. 313]
MFLTQLKLDIKRRDTRRYLGSPQVMHAVVAAACSGRDANAEADSRESLEAIPTYSDPNDSLGPGRVLWRVDEGAFTTKLYIVSPTTPDMEKLENTAGAGEARTVDYAPFLRKLSEGQLWAFRLAANPMYAKSQDSGNRGKRYGHVSIMHQAKWLLERCEKHGFNIASSDGHGDTPRISAPGENVALDGSASTEQGDDDPAASVNALVVRRERPSFRRRRKDGSGNDRVTINRTVYEGILRVTDAERLRHMLVSGLGASKAYGCGLMTLAYPH